MNVNEILWISEQPPRADKTALGAINRPPTGVRIFCESPQCYAATPATLTTLLAGVRQLRKASPRSLAGGRRYLLPPCQWIVQSWGLGSHYIPARAAGLSPGRWLLSGS